MIRETLRAKNKIELLSPAGSWDSFLAALRAGADAIYAGGTRFGARAFAENFDDEQICKAIDLAHLHGCRFYLTVNTLLKEEELTSELYDYLLPFYRQGLDAVIVQDLGVFRFVQKHFPDLAIHASTQMTITGAYGARFIEAQGAERIVPARELSLSEISEIADQTRLDIECFVHGALCYCYSGQCLFSSLLGGRSGNRGQCAQPCRLPYTQGGRRGYLLSLKDICALDILPEIIEAGVNSFKLEGRMKKPEYVASVTSIYKKYLDLYLKHGTEHYQVERKDKELLMDIYNRSGMHSGYYQVSNGPEMLADQRPNHTGLPAARVQRQKGREVLLEALRELHPQDVIELSTERENHTLSGKEQKCFPAGTKFKIIVPKNIHLTKGQILYRTRNQELLDQIRENYIEKNLQTAICGQVEMSPGLPASLTLSLENPKTAVTVYGEPVQDAQKHPLDTERIRKQLHKTGESPFFFAALETKIEGDIFYPMQQLNELRRRAMDALEQKVIKQYKRLKPECICHVRTETDLDTGREEKEPSGMKTALISNRKQLEVVLASGQIQRVYIESELWPELMDEWNSFRSDGKQLYIALPYICRKEGIAFLDKYGSSMIECCDGFLVRNIEEHQYILDKGWNVSIMADTHLYQWNRCARAFWQEQGITEYALPYELNVQELSKLPLKHAELTVYGYQPMMISAQCIQKNLHGCSGKSGLLTMTDRYQKKIVVKNCCTFCYNVIYNSQPLVLRDEENTIQSMGIHQTRLVFTTENEYETEQVLELFASEDPEAVTAIKERLWGNKITKGHFKRGVR